MVSATGALGTSVGSVAASMLLTGCPLGMDQYLYSAYKGSFWRARYYQHTNFAMENLRYPSSSMVQFGNTAIFKIPKGGDLIYYTYMVFVIPGIRGCRLPSGPGAACDSFYQFPAATDSPCVIEDSVVFDQAAGHCNATPAAWLKQTYNACYADFDDAEYCEEDGARPCVDPNRPVNWPHWAHWANAIGQLLVKEATLVIGNTPIARLWNDFLFMWEELTGKPGKRLTEMIGKRYSVDDLILDSLSQRTLYVPLPFFYTQAPGNAVSLISLMYTNVEVHVTFEQLQNCVIRKDRETAVVKCGGGGQLQPTDLQAYLDVTNVYLDLYERDRFSVSHFDALITQVQRQEWQLDSSKNSVDVQFSHPIIELIWAVRRQCNEAVNAWFNYSGIRAHEPIDSASLDFNHQARVAQQPGSYFRLVQPYQAHTNIPDACVYCYSFALWPQEPQPSGSANFSRIQDVTFNVWLQNGLELERTTLIMFGRNWNLLKYRDGLGGQAFV